MEAKPNAYNEYNVVLPMKGWYSVSSMQQVVYSDPKYDYNISVEMRLFDGVSFIPLRDQRVAISLIMIITRVGKRGVLMYYQLGNGTISLRDTKDWCVDYFPIFQFILSVSGS